MVSHKPCYFVLFLVTWLALLSCLFLNFLSGWGSQLLNIKLFMNDTGGISNSYYMEITPANWTFIVWAVVYFWQLLWMGYALTTICRKSQKGYLYYSPPFIHWCIYMVYTFTLVCNIAWLFTLDRQLPHVALGFLITIGFTLYLCIGVSVRDMYKYYPDLVRCGHPNEARWVVGFIHNGLGAYAAWITIATVINLAVVLAYVVKMPQEVASSIALGVLAVELVFYTMVDLVMAERYLRFLFTPYVIVITALVGSIHKNWDVTKPNSMYSVALLAIATTVFVIKICVSSVRQKADPVFVQESKMYVVQMAMSQNEPE